FRKRVRLIHELRELAGTKKLAHRRSDRLRVDQIARHRRLHLLMDRHLFLDRPFHSLEPDSELILKQLAYCTNTTITKMIDVISLKLGRILSHLQDITNDLVEVPGREQWIVYAVALGFAHLDVELQTPNA